MDPWAPINGISLERYAELSAEVDGTQDPEKQAEIVGRLGVQRADWEAAKSGWTARMQDMSLMGQVAMRYMPLYQAALAKKSPGGAPQISFEDYVAMSACVPVIGYEGMLQHYKVTSAQWTMIAGHWNSVIPTNPQYMQYGLLVQQETARIRAGGQPKPVAIGAGGAAAQGPGAQGAMPAAANPYAQQPANPYAQQAANPYTQQTPYAQQAANAYGQQAPYGQQAHYNAQAQHVGAQLGSAFNAFGSALGSLVDSAVGGLGVGARVMVQWSDGNRYPGTVTAVQSGQVEVAFPDGRRFWVPQGYVSVTY
ncbi:MAG: hypothetical protein BGO98_48945 [Myxococcales bacterium 68-20]|nr:hypothetical protein [Myxococcales bacterium]OJY29754.1 MAG: hypothetical protein BGO98_48945 [Myxococcales bacterium 68-20]